MKHPIRRRLMYFAFQGLRALIQRLPLRLGRRLGAALGLFGYAVLAGQRRLALKHLHQALSATLTPGARRRIARGVFRNLGQTAAEWFILSRLSLPQIRRMVSEEGLAHLRQALAEGNGAILVGAHLGNWEVGPLYLRSLGFEGGVLARRLRYSEYESFLISMRGAKGIPTYARGSLKEVAKLLRANQIVGMLADQDVDSLEGVFVDFFGRPAYTPVGPAALSVMTGAPILPCFMLREGERFRVVIEPGLRATARTDRIQAVAQLTQAWSEVVERYIRRYPDQWVWMHRRWKTQPGTASAAQPRERPDSAAPSTIHPALATLVLAGLIGLSGCGRSGGKASARSAAPEATQQMSGFTLTGYEEDGGKRWELEGSGASADGHIVTILHPNGVGYEPERTAFLQAGAAQMNQVNRHVRLEHDVTIHTSDGIWFSSPVLHWIPDRNEIATDQPVRIETDHMLIRGRGAHGLTQLKHAVVERDVELVLNPSDLDVPHEGPKQVTITCDGPLAFDYAKNIATFEDNVHVQDPGGDLYSDRLVAYLDPVSHTIRYAEALGRVRIHQHQNTALSERAVYEPAIGKITLVGRPSLLIYPSEGAPGGNRLSFGGLNPASTTTPRPAIESRGGHAAEAR